MSSQPSLPEDPRLREIALALAKTRGASMVCDASCRMVWVSDELKVLIGEEDEGKIGYGKHLIEVFLSPLWSSRVTDETQPRLLWDHLPYLVYDTPGGREEAKEIFTRAYEDWPPPRDWILEVPPEAVAEWLFDSVEAIEPPPVLTTDLEFLQEGMPPAPITETIVRLRDDEGFMGTAVLYQPNLAATVLNLVARGDEGMFERMARLFNPGRRKAAILFADLEGSAQLSRRLASAAYFNLVRAITTAIDEVVVDHSGIVGKHAGDGVTAFFLADDLGSPSRAARAAIQAARAIGASAAVAAAEMRDETGLLESADCLVNVGVHWGGTLYMGQLVTGGRLEVTALGDQVNECARIQESARSGEALASKSLIEHLSDDDADALGLDPDRVTYTTVKELPGASAKAARDAGEIPVTIL